MVGLMHCLTNLLFCDIPLLYYDTSFNSSIICCLFFFWYIYRYLPFGTSIWLLVSLFCRCNLFGDFEILLILSAIWLPIKSPVVSAVFWITLFEAVFIASVVDYLAIWRSFWPYLLLNFLPMFLAKYKNPYTFTYILSFGSIEYLIFIMAVLSNY